VLFVALLIAAGMHPSLANAQLATGMLSGSAVARAVLKYFGKEGAEEATEYLARQGGREVAERVARNALAEGGEEATEQVSRLVAKHGPEVLTALDNAPAVTPVLSALGEIPQSQVESAIARLAAGASGRELAETVSRYGATALRSELRHPGIGGMLVRTLGDDGAALAKTLTDDQAIVLARHADDLAKLPAQQRTGVFTMLRADADRMVSFMGRFAADNPGKTLFTVATTTVILAEPERILGGEEIVFDAEGNPVVVSKAGIAGRTMKAGGEAVAHVSMNYLQPLFYAVITFLGCFAVLFMVLKLWHTHQREKLVTATAVEAAAKTPAASLDGPQTVDGKVKQPEEQASA
jgi:hypothetical protein